MRKKDIQQLIDNDIPIYGDIDYRGKCPQETPEQITAVGIVRRTMPKLGAVMFHVKNEGKRIRGAAKEKVSGMVTGTSDLVAPGNPSFVCEIKRKDHTESKISDEQIKYLINAKALGSFVCVALGHQAVIDAAKDWELLQ